MRKTPGAKEKKTARKTVVKKTNSKNGTTSNRVVAISAVPAIALKKITIKPRSKKQTEAIKKIKANQITFLLGPAGTGKSHVAMMQGIAFLLAGKCEKIILTRPVVEAGESLGFLPGSFEEKLQPYLSPLFNIMSENVKKDLETLAENKQIEIVPLAYMRGRSFNNCYVLADEMQNASNEQLKMMLTRIGENSKMIIDADPDQSDLRRKNDVIEISKMLQESNDIDRVIFREEDIVRNAMIKDILKVFREIKKEALS